MTRPPSSHTAAVVFDLDGTLLDTMTLAPTAYADTIHALGGPHVSPSDIVAAWHIGPTPVVLAHFLGRPTSVDDIECFYRHFETAGAAARPFPGVVEMVDTLGRAGYRQGIFTSATRRAATLMLSAAGLDGYFPTVICGDEIDEPKPAPEGIWLACQYLGVSVAATTYVGDAEVDLRCAASAGTVAVHARWGATTTAVDAPLVADRPGDVIELLLRQTRLPSGPVTFTPNPLASPDRHLRIGTGRQGQLVPLAAAAEAVARLRALGLRSVPLGVRVQRGGDPARRGRSGHAGARRGGDGVLQRVRGQQQPAPVPFPAG